MNKTAKKSAGIVVNQEVRETSVSEFISQAIAQNLPVETMEKLFALRERVKLEQAREAFTHAMSNFQANIPTIEKTKKVMNKDGRTIRYVYAPLDKIVDQIRKPLADNGLSYSWDVENTPEMITAIVTIKHVLGHSEKSSFSVPIDKEGYMTAPQKYASALTFAKRYSLTNALGISTGDEDTDATDVGKEKEPMNPKAKIVFRLRMLGEKTATSSQCEEAVLHITALPLVPENFDEIINRLDVAIGEAHEN